MADDSIRYQTGFGGHFESEALEGALPREQNSPRQVPHGLYAEQLNGSPFTARRGRNLRSWLYRIRPTVAEGRFERSGDGHLSLAYLGQPTDPNLVGWKPLPLEGDHDFVDGLRTLCGAGDPASRHGVAVHLFTAQRSMERRAFASADGDLLLAPDTGELRLVTELGRLSISPGQIAVVPQGLRFAVELHAGPARGYVFEPYGRHFELPDRGPIGANGLADERHFEHPVAAFDEDGAEWRISLKQGGLRWETTRTGTPFDVVAWHGNYAPYRYDLERFSPMGAVRVDHPDPSIYTVLTAPLDRPGDSAADFVFFPARWEMTEHTFRPPFHHRNATTEINGIVRGAGGDRVFARGGCFITPPFTGHGVRADSIDRYLEMSDREADRPERLDHSSMWIQLETLFPMRVTPWAADAEGRDRSFGEGPRGVRSRFHR